MQNANRCAIVHRSSGLRSWLKASLSRLGHKVVSMCATTEEGFQRACLLRPDLMLVEAGVVEGKSGNEGCAGIGMMRDIQRQLPVPVIYIARGLGPKMIEAARPTRPLGFLNRPLRVRDLMGMLEVYRGERYSPSSPLEVRESRPPAGRTRGLQARLCGTLDCLSVGVIIVLRDMRLEYANLMGRRILRRAKPLAVVAGRLSLADAALERRLSHLVRQSSFGSLTLATEAATLPELRILLCPIPADDLNHGAMALYLTDPREQLQEVELQLRRFHGLTRAESRVVRALLVRPGRAAVAEQLFISPQTVGTHLQNVYGKLGVHNQQELIHYIVTGPVGNLLRLDCYLPLRQEEPLAVARLSAGDAMPA